MTDTRPHHTAPAEPEADLGEVAVLNRDLLFGARIANTLRALGYRVGIDGTTAAFADRLRATRPPAVLAIVDMGVGVDWDTVRALTADPDVATPILAFGPHKDIDGRRAAKAAGVDRLVSNGEFHRDMVGLVRRYARPAPSRSTG